MKRLLFVVFVLSLLTGCANPKMRTIEQEGVLATRATPLPATLVVEWEAFTPEQQSIISGFKLYDQDKRELFTVSPDKTTESISTTYVPGDKCRAYYLKSYMMKNAEMEFSDNSNVVVWCPPPVPLNAPVMLNITPTLP